MLNTRFLRTGRRCLGHENNPIDESCMIRYLLPTCENAMDYHVVKDIPTESAVILLMELLYCGYPIIVH